MAGRELPPPPSRVQEFEISWRNWLYLLFKKVVRRTYTIELPTYNSVSPAVNAMTNGLVGITPVVLADDTTQETRNFSFEIPENWIVGSDLKVRVRFMNTATQTGVVTVNTRILYLSTALLEVSTGSTTLTTTNTLANNVVANTLHVTADWTIAGSALALGDSVSFQLERNVSDSCVADVAYQVILVDYTGFLNHE